MRLDEAKRILECLIFAAPQPISAEELGELLQLEKNTVERLIEQLEEAYKNRGIALRAVAGGYQFVTQADLAPWVERLGRPVINAPLSIAGLETLAIIAYQQPITKNEIEQIRGVRSDSAIHTLVERELVMETGRKDGPGRPILYGTTDAFLIHFGLESLTQLPKKPKRPTPQGGELEAAATGDE